MDSSTTIPIRIGISTTDPWAELGIRIHLDGVVIHENIVKERYYFSHQVSDDDGDHEFGIELFGKTQAHTKIDEAGNILKDAMLVIDDIEFDDIDVAGIFTSTAEYHHDFNGTKEPIVAKFYDHLGCNGTVKLKFTSPLYLWLLESM